MKPKYKPIIKFGENNTKVLIPQFSPITIINKEVRSMKYLSTIIFDSQKRYVKAIKKLLNTEEV